MKALIVGFGLVGSLFAHAGGGAVINPGTPDAAIMRYDPALGRTHLVQLDYLTLVGRPDVVWFEDGSGETRAQFERQRFAHALRTLHPSGCTFIPTEIESTEDR